MGYPIIFNFEIFYIHIHDLAHSICLRCWIVISYQISSPLRFATDKNSAFYFNLSNTRKKVKHCLIILFQSGWYITVCSVVYGLGIWAPLALVRSIRPTTGTRGPATVQVLHCHCYTLRFIFLFTDHLYFSSVPIRFPTTGTVTKKRGQDPNNFSDADTKFILNV